MGILLEIEMLRSVSSSPADGQDPAVVPSGEINETKTNEMSGKLITSDHDMEVDKDKDKDNDKGGKLDEGDVNKIDMIDVGARKMPVGNQKGSDPITKNSFL